ncbi:ferritin-like domain-containing protein [Fomitopsis serialis]|uniref:ferritin-like domain-containing protein n=1 Tax=Fomitopsis serialis TaxID=139415 RepID=UPI002008A0F7|nr:ferritin-like domain-containing protein [Neoantrodia serialis]KAH9912573.1 ferritin-like domain-containing protein [Neoantrodia serialis]
MFTKTFAALIAAAVVLGAPTPGPAPTQTNVLQFALSLEYLESAFYSGALAQYDAQAFADAGFPSWVRGRFEQIAQHEQTHVSTLQNALGDQAPQACQYSFGRLTDAESPYTDPRSFVSLSFAIEGVGAAAYLGASKFIDDKDTLGVAASILSIEERQVAWVSSAVLKQQPWDGPFETPLSPSGAYSLASQFITSCPSSNPPLPVTPFPALSVSNASPWPGSTINLTFDNSNNADAAYAVWLNGLDAVFTPLDGNGQTTVPDGLHGTVYVGVASSEQTPMSDASMVTGLAIVQMPFDSTAVEA